VDVIPTIAIVINHNLLLDIKMDKNISKEALWYLKFLFTICFGILLLTLP